jgi:hypothetical protein
MLVFVRKIIVESDKEWYTNLVTETKINKETGEVTKRILDLDFEKDNNLNNIKIKIMKLLKTYGYHLMNSTFLLTNIRTLFNKYLKKTTGILRLSAPDTPGGKAENNFGKSKNNFFPDILFPEKEQQLDKKEKRELKLEKKIKNKLEYNLSKLYEINDNFVDIEHPYLLNSKMKPEIIRKLKNEDNIINIFNILKDILQLDKTIYFENEDVDI